MSGKGNAKSKKHTEEHKAVEGGDIVTTYPVIQVPRIMSPLQGFVDFVREQGVVGLAIGIVLGTQVKTLVDQVVASFLNPLLGLLLPGSGNLDSKTFHLTLGDRGANFTYGAFLSEFISFLTIAALVYFIVKQLKLDKLDKKKA